MSETKFYKVNEIFYSVQAEGFNVGRPAVFVRFSGCNLKCQWCDTKHKTFRIMSADEILKKIMCITPLHPNIMVVFTGGEPTLQLEQIHPLCTKYYCAIENYYIR